MASTDIANSPDDAGMSRSTINELLELHDRLDALWISYLQHLDHYTRAQQLLQKHMSKGYISLARANFNARDGIRRYGKDYFHERAIASTHVRVSSRMGGAGMDVEVVKWSDRSASNEDSGSDASATQKTEPDVVEDQAEGMKQQPSAPATPFSDDTATRDEDDSDLAKDLQEKGARSSISLVEKSRSESLHWFGILVPPDLRTALASFTSALRECVADATNAAKRMREVEAGIRKLRKEIKKVEKGG